MTYILFYWVLNVPHRPIFFFSILFPQLNETLVFASHTARFKKRFFRFCRFPSGSDIVKKKMFFFKRSESCLRECKFIDDYGRKIALQTDDGIVLDLFIDNKRKYQRMQNVVTTLLTKQIHTSRHQMIVLLIGCHKSQEKFSEF